MYRNLGQVQGFFGPVHTNGNHWTLVYIDLVANTLLYIDPLSPPNEQAVAETYTYNWLEWGLLHNNNVPNCSVPTSLTAITTPHPHQKDNCNCGIFTMCVCINIYKFRVFCQKMSTLQLTNGNLFSVHKEVTAGCSYQWRCNSRLQRCHNSCQDFGRK